MQQTDGQLMELQDVQQTDGQLMTLQDVQQTDHQLMQLQDVPPETIARCVDATLQASDNQL